MTPQTQQGRCGLPTFDETVTGVMVSNVAINLPELPICGDIDQHFFARIDMGEQNIDYHIGISKMG